jgi:DNA topoisomerase II
MTDAYLAATYQNKTEKEHILSNPDTYIGSIEEVSSETWVADPDNEKIIEKSINYVPGLFKLFDEAIVNARDHILRQQSVMKSNPDARPVTYIETTIDQDGTITIINDGDGIDVAKHPENQIWIPEMIFAHLRTSTNYDKDKDTIIGGKNGFGVKLIFVWSTWGSIETVDHTRGLKYHQEFKNNLEIIEKPKITKCSKGKPYTKISFRPDYARLKLSGLSADVRSLFHKRVYDIAAITDKSIKVKYNGTPVVIKTFSKYVDLYIGKDSKRVYESPNERWEYSAALSPSGTFAHVSFVNGIHTTKGGKHVEYIANQISRKMVEFIESKAKKKMKVNANTIKDQLILFVRSDIVKPSFDSQTKDFMNTPVSKFGSICTVSDGFIEKLAKMGVMEHALFINDVKDQSESAKTNGTKTNKIRGIPKLSQANWAGTTKSSQCTLIITEGDSAKAGVLSALIPSDRDKIGIYPLRGKGMNVRGRDIRKVTKNEEISDLKKILGLQDNRIYETIEDVNKYLNYSKVLFMTDQDLDGSHIKGLCINLFHYSWKSLTRIEGFLNFMNTPILKAKKGALEHCFYNEGQYAKWKNENNGGNGWGIKYYKGLGTSTKAEWVQYFKNKQIIGFQAIDVALTDNTIDMVFNKDRADDRKEWIRTKYDRNKFLDTNNSLITYEEFIDNELIHFSKYDCDRNIPNLMDGLKISLRKVLYACFKRCLTKEIKVAQLSGYVSEHSSYHHGEVSLNQTIVGMAQEFTGSNNVSILVPSGQFGTRLAGGKDSASPRYTYTYLNSIARCLFSEQDDPILNYLSDDGTLVEPQFYLPVVPLILINGAEGIGTGFSTSIPCYNLQDIIQYLRLKLRGDDGDYNPLPYYEGFTGSVERTDTGALFRGVYEKIDENTICVTELPVGVWTQDFKVRLDDLTMEEGKDAEGKKIKLTPWIKSFRENSSDTVVKFTITFVNGRLAELESKAVTNGVNGIERLLKLTTTKTTTNMYLFTHTDKLVKFNTIKDIIDEYYNHRLPYYDIRKKYLVNNLEQKLPILANKHRYVQELISGDIKVLGKKRDEIIRVLKEKKYYEGVGESGNFKYLTQMPIISVCTENVEKLSKEYADAVNYLEKVKATTPNDMWNKDLDMLEAAYIQYRIERTSRMSDGDAGDDVSDVASQKKKVLKKKKNTT